MIITRRLVVIIAIAVAFGALAHAQGQAEAKAVRVLYLKAPQALAGLWAKWNGKYVLFAHKVAGINKLEDLNRRRLICAFINTETIVGDATAFRKAGGLTVGINIQNNPDVYAKQFLQETNFVAFLIPAVARHYGFFENDKLIELRIK